MKRKHETTPRPTKKQRTETQALINKLQDEDEDVTESITSGDAIKAVEMANEEVKNQIKREFKTLDPKSVAPERRILLEQKLEYAETLLTDRLREINNEADKRLHVLQERRSKRNNTQDVDEQIEECLDIGSQKCSECSWKIIGKMKCITTRLKATEMSEEQQVHYKTVLKEIIAKGWRLKTN